MDVVWQWTGWLAGDPGGAGDWRSNARLASAVVVMAAIASVARVLYRLGRYGPGKPLATRAAALLAVFVPLCGVSQLAVLIDGGAPVRLVPAALRVLAAALWVVVAVRLPAVAARLAQPLRVAPAAPAPGGPFGTEGVTVGNKEVSRCKT